MVLRSPPGRRGCGAACVLVAVLVGAAASRRDLQRLLAALSWPLCVAAVAGSSWHALPAALCVLQQREPTAALWWWCAAAARCATCYY